MMASSLTGICYMCSMRPLVSSLLQNGRQGGQTLRNASTLQRKRKPSRMSLSPKVASPAAPAKEATRQKRQSRNSPWAGTNMKTAHMTRAPNPRSKAQLHRSAKVSKHVPKTKEELEEGKKGRLYHALKMQRRLSEVSYGQRASVKKRIAEIEEFEQFDLLPEIQEAMSKDVFQHLTTATPSPIQKLAIPALLGRRKSSRAKQKNRLSGMEQYLLAAETGSGKTLAYLLPVVDAIKRAEAEEAEAEALELKEKERRLASDPTYVEPPLLDDRTNPSQARPRAIVLVPTSELVSQVTAVAKRISHVAKFRAAAISSSISPAVIRNRLLGEAGIDLVVSTPQLLASICESEPNLLSRVSHIVIDEADSLLDRSFSPSTTSLVDRAAPSLKQLVLCSATIPRSLDNFLRQRFPNMTRLTTPNLHAVPRRVQLGTVDIEKDPYRGNRDLACADAIWTLGKEGTSGDTPPDLPAADVDDFVLKRIIVFVNERETTGPLAEYLQSKGIDAEALTRDTSEQRQAELLAAFTHQPTRKPDVKKWEGHPQGTVSFKTADKTGEPRRGLPNTRVLVTTDLGSRGIDTLAVRNVILYDVPHSTIDFLHRLGRVGRMNRRGRGIVLVGRKDRRDVVREVRDAMFKGQALI